MHSRNAFAPSPDAGAPSDDAKATTGPHRFALLVSAISGSALSVALGSELCTDGQRIFVSRDDTDDMDGLAVQAALLAIGTFDGSSVPRLAARPKSRGRYLLLESRRAAAELEFVLPPQTLRRVLEAYDGPVPADRRESLDLALSSRSVPEAPPWMGVIRPGKLLRANVSTGGRPPTARDKDGTSEREDIPEAEEDAQESKLLKLLQAPGGMRNPLTSYLQKLLGTGRSPGGESAGGGEMLVAGHRTSAGSSKAGEVVDPSLVPPDLSFEAAPYGYRYPEWDWRSQSYRTDWCTVTEYDPRQDNDERFEVGPNPVLRRKLARIGIGLQRHRRQAEGDLIDVDAVIERLVDRRSGFDDGEHRIYERKLKTSYDLGVTILLDATGSTGESEQGKRIFDEQRLVVAELTSAFESLGARVGAFAFQSWGRGNVQFLRIKDYSDRYDGAAQQRLGALKPGGFTRLGAAIRHGAFVAKSKSGAVNNLLVVVGDGLPYDDGYEHRYAEEDCRRALDEAVDAGVACACLSVRSATEPAALQRAWGSVPFEALQKPEDLAKSASLLFPKALKSAAASRRRI